MSFVQNLARNGGLSQAERLVVNLQAQEYDHLKMIDSFNQIRNPDKDLESFKIEQYKKLSWIRTENEKAANAQGLIKARQDFQNLGIQNNIDLSRQEF